MVIGSNQKKELGNKGGKSERSGLEARCSELQKGFTLIEIIVVIVLLSIVAAITIKFLIDSLTHYTLTVEQKGLFDEGKLALERMCRDLRDAKNITAPASGGTGSTLTFTRTHATAQDVADEAITFRRNAGAGTLEKVKASPSAIVTLAENVSAFTVTRGISPNHEIMISLTLSRTIAGVTMTLPLRTTVVPKNFATDTTYKYFKNSWREEGST